MKMTVIRKVIMSCLFLLLITLPPSFTATELELPDAFSKSHHTNNWAMLVYTSRFWFNYRHVANVLSIYRIVKKGWGFLTVRSS